MNNETTPAASGLELPELPEPFEIEWPQLHRQGLRCGVEDRDLTDRYDYAEYGWQDGVDRAADCVPEQIFTADQMHAYARQALAAQPAPVESVAQGGIPAGWTIREEHGALLVGSPIGGPGSKWMALEDRGTLERRLLIALAQTLMTPTPATGPGWR